ncbi:alpha/beta fold hydrolase [Thalassotalea sp. PS06]|uniref:alpha/beta fold hydrolase n=1 Tax=Thalassotalea sp. PS06 TaxID=2594005 RepID=UPI001163C74E|nr:alpha/beta hydrolase [Thalassotalea sp. PS06]QDP02796.1 alpha/beta hydrolase [Thalassotalea sp. PS06]
MTSSKSGQSTFHPLPENASFKFYGGNGPDVHFYHANGFSSATYQPFIDALTQSFTVSALDSRAVWPNIGKPPKDRNWQMYAKDLIAFIETHYDQPIIAVGHSLGASCTTYAAILRPDLFTALVLIEPAMLKRSIATAIKWMPDSILKHIDPVKTTLKKQDRWACRQSYREYCEQRRSFKRFHPKSFEAFVEHSVVEDGDGVTLRFPKAWEAHNFSRPPYLLKEISRLTVPTVAIRGKPNLFFSDEIWQRWQKSQPNAVFLEDTEHGHLLPLESPDSCYQLIVKGLAKLGL